ncbi:energy-coupling factor transporter transmembrane component T family protein [Saccharibacillus alkalitolerans]|uniref:Energy-coupling factor transporter transmembrane protein EcfT n=1 Tax=Saccharibacillus alkalitolerans TaxID=2705290 RepID=A0ABX0F8W6_9BACL|nr:energy-coupling factor transporter transmembrane component T [Saccharibacillus alkalitolerans]NGZ77393.1 energy-coupling factor transporter transmembrane protein EcfT [Saccharibacillus alkalitolerans]
MRDKLIIGRMIPTGSKVHGLDPRAKITAMLLFTAALILSDGWAQLAVLALLAAAVLAATKIPPKTYLRTMRPLRWLMLFVFLFQLFAGPGAGSAEASTAATALWTWTAGPVTLTSAGLSAALLAVSRMALLIVFTALLTFTTTPSMLSRGIEGMLKPISRGGTGAERFSLMMRLALRFIPALLEEAQTILKAQAARGADYEEMNAKDKARLLLSLLVPVTVGAFRRAEELTTSLEARGYRIGAPRTAYRQLAWRAADTWFTLLFALLPAGALIMRLVS